MVIRCSRLLGLGLVCAGALLGTLVAAAQMLESPLGSAPSSTRLPPLEGGSGTIPPVRAGGDWTVVPGLEAMPIPTASVQAAIPIYRGLLQMQRRLTGASPATARGLAFLAGLEGSVGNNSESERLYTEAVEILQRRSLRGEDLAWVHNQQGLSRANRSADALAITSYQAALRAFPTNAPALRDKRGLVQQNLATSHFALGDADAAEAAYLQALEELDGAHAAPRFRAAVRQNLAGLYVRLGDFSAGEHHLLEALDVAPASDRILTFSVLNNLGDCLRSQHRHAEAEQQFRAAETLLTGALDARRITLLNRLENAWDAGDLPRMEHFLAEARALVSGVGEPSPVVAASLSVAAARLALAHGRLDEAADLFERTMALAAGRQPGTRRLDAEILAQRALIANLRQQRHQALELGQASFAVELDRLNEILSFGSELQRLEYQRQAYPYDHLANLGDPDLLADAVFAAKGAVLDSLLVERQRAREAVTGPARELLDQIRETRRTLLAARAQGQGPGLLGRWEAELKRLETSLAQAIRREVSAPAFSRPRAAKVQAALARDQVLIEFVEYRPFLAARWADAAFGALVIPAQGAIQWVPLGPAAAVEEALGLLRSQAGSTPRGGARPLARELLTPRVGLETLSQQLWQPLAAKVPASTRKLVLAPDGLLHLVPWAALLDTSTAFVAERFDVVTVTSGRDLLQDQGKVQGRTLVVLGDGRGDLPFARREAEELARTAQSKGWSTTLRLGEAANEAVLRAQTRPTILHLATHGSVLSTQEDTLIAQRLSREPMYRGYLMLGGTNTTLQAWRQGEVVPVESDGIVTAEEVAGLDLAGTWLTVLSACDTGRGESRSGEGILGLRRGFALAGSRRLLFTLWAVDDQATARWMSDFYTALLAGQDPASAFATTQRHHLKAVRSQHDALSAVLQAGGFVLGE